MFKRCLAILLIITLTASGFQRFVVYAGFELNQNYIAKTLCVNRARPWMHCEGRCYFMRKLKAAEENEKQQTAKDNFSRLELAFLQPGINFKFHRRYTETSIVFNPVTYRADYIDPYLQSLFRPPQV